MERERIWRISHKNYASDIFSGEGARRFGGRFNRPGSSVIYCSCTLSLALLEILVQVDDWEFLSSCVYMYADVPKDLVFEAQLDTLPSDWDARPVRSGSQRYGDDWLQSRTSLVLKVPSVILPMESNYLINPDHPAYSEIIRSDVEVLPLDQRLKFG